jgi:nicotinate-nucleotide adenylyltransferase
MNKIGLYGGTFDPIHHGHLILAREAVEQLSLGRLIFIPAGISPFKEAPAASSDLRLAMLHAAIGQQTEFVVDDCELQRPPPSYAIDTVTAFQARYPSDHLYYLIGEDNVATLPRWHRFNELEKLVTFVVLDRSGSAAKHKYQIVQRKIDISATEVRNRVAQGRSIRYLVPSAVEEIIRQGNLYREGAR